MNKKRRMEIRNIIVELNIIKEKLENILDEEQISYDNIPDSLLFSEMAEVSEESIDSLEEAIERLEDIVY